ncbi:hypothetical protein K227x_49000 [Rubripirellula lacrimiformis]|uniref:Gingipain domain-containing protein n=1 Tax=Rubripirellula lacrimiformis TaxID=1930273 RepID=A0A517NH71_9BACT|nr:C25 family cysteine peptidase [Rubripirellula lacrimiformis]QDT06490.1 hypothetical protein K227x_49000 [Rubripirellula lacrimiformis]
MTSARIVAITLALVVIGIIATGDAPAADIVAVCPADFRTELEPWLQHRRGQGMSVDVVASKSDAESLSRSIRAAADQQTRYVVLIGDAPTIGVRGNANRQIPMHYRSTTVTAMWGSPPTLSTDQPFGNLDGDDDGTTEAAVGRLPVSTANELQQAIQRIVAYETSQDFGPWRNQVQLVGGMGGFGMMADAAIESVTRTVVTGVLPASTQTTIAYASPGHPFFPQGKSFTGAVLANYQRGSAFWVYAGHGQVTELDRVPQSAAGIPVLDRQSAQRLDRPAGESPIALMLACYTGAMDAPENSIAETMWLSPGGPIAVIAGSRVTMPYGNATAAVGLIDGVFEQKLPRLGDAWRNTLDQMQQEDSANPVTPENANSRMMIDALATMISPAGSKLVDERREHLMLYNLIGDPTLNMHHPETIDVSVDTSVVAGDPIAVTVTSPIGGKLSVAIDRPLGGAKADDFSHTDSVTPDPIAFDPNRTRLATLEMEINAGRSATATFVLPAKTTGPVIARAFVEGEQGFANGAARTILRAP